MSMEFPQPFGAYRLLRPLGEGAFAAVFEAESLHDNTPVALKVLHGALSTDRQFVQSFQREAHILTTLEHPGIVRVRDAGTHEASLYIAMTLCPSGSLADRLRVQGPMTWEQILGLLDPLCAALDYAHAQRVVHHDVKPGNILFGADDAPLLADFGLSRMLGASMMSTRLNGGMIGTPEYMAPELWEQGVGSPATDVYALACVVYEALTGTPLFAGQMASQVMFLHLRGPQLPAAWPDSVPPGLSAVLARALRRDPAARTPSAGELLRELRALAATSATTASEASLASLCIPTQSRLTFDRARLAQVWRRGTAVIHQVLAKTASNLLVHTYRGLEQVDLDSGTATLLVECPGSLAASSADGGIVAFFHTGEITVWDRERSEVIMATTPTTHWTQSLVLSGDGSTLAIVTYQHVEVWDTRSSTLRVRIQPPASPSAQGETPAEQQPGWRWITQCAAFSSDGKLLAISWGAHRNTGTASDLVVPGPVVQLWSLPDNGLCAELQGHRLVAHTLAFSPDGAYLAAGADRAGWNSDDWRGKSEAELPGEVVLWRTADEGEEVRLGPMSGEIDQLRFAPSGRELIAAGDRLVVWSVREGHATVEREDWKPENCYGSFITPDAQTVVTVSREIAAQSLGWNDQIAGWSIGDGEPLFSWAMPAHSLGNALITPDSASVIEVDKASNVRFLDMLSGEETRRLGNYLPSHGRMAITRDGRLLALSCGILVRLVRAEDGVVLWTFEGHPRPTPKGEIAFLADETQIVYPADRATVGLLRTADGGLARTLSDVGLVNQARGWLSNRGIGDRPYDYAECVAVSSDGELLAFGATDCQVRIYQVKTGVCTRRIDCGKKQPIALAFSPDGRHLAVTQDDVPASVWDVASGAEVRRIVTNPWPSGDSTRVAYSGDGRFLAVGHEQGLIHLIRPQGSEPVYTIHAHTTPIEVLTFSRDSRYLLTGAKDDGLRLWRVQ